MKDKEELIIPPLKDPLLWKSLLSTCLSIITLLSIVGFYCLGTSILVSTIIDGLGQSQFWFVENLLFFVFAYMTMLYCYVCADTWSRVLENLWVFTVPTMVLSLLSFVMMGSLFEVVAVALFIVSGLYFVRVKPDGFLNGCLDAVYLIVYGYLLSILAFVAIFFLILVAGSIPKLIMCPICTLDIVVLICAIAASAIAFLYSSWANRFLSLRNHGFESYKILIVFLGLLSLSLVILPESPTAKFDALENSTFLEEALSSEHGQSKIQSFLLESYLWPYYYIETSHELNRTIYNMYGERTARVLYPLAESLLSPWIYSGLASDSSKAMKYYSLIFDEDIQKSSKKIGIERERDFRRNNDFSKQADIDSQTVRVVKREIHKKLSSTHASIQIHEKYRNLRYNNQEVFYYFTLPKNAAITGAWLGSDDVKKFKHRVSPRGAASRTYKDEVRKKVDPALLEKVGPEQYRVQVYPIEREDVDFWFQYDISNCDGQNGEDFIQMPNILERRNVFDDENTVTTVTTECVSDQSGFPIYSEALPGLDITDLPNLAIMVDSSFSMKKNSEKVSSILELFELKYSFVPDTYQSSFSWAGVGEIKHVTGEGINYIGGNSLRTTLNQYAQSPLCKNKELVLVLTDKGSYDLLGSEKSEFLWECNSSLFLIHLDELPVAYEDDIFRQLTKNGGVSPDIDTALAMFQALKMESTIDVSSTCIWKQHPTEEISFQSGVEASRYIEFLERSGEDIEERHKIALKSSVVTADSSMIVLVNKEQVNSLEWEEGRADRFDRDSNNGHESLSRLRRLSVWNGTNSLLPSVFMLIVVLMQIRTND